jgi:8-oxo-dGTP diphosphatase
MIYKKPHLTVDGVIIQNRSVVLIKRKHEPFKDNWALPGGFVEYGETTEQSVFREVLEETGLKTQIRCLAGVYSDPRRDPRGHTITIVYLLRLVTDSLQAGDDASAAKFFKLNKLPELAFDHNQILHDVMERFDNVLSEM